jgi:hypothetical protein
MRLGEMYTPRGQRGRETPEGGIRKITRRYSGQKSHSTHRTIKSTGTRRKPLRMQRATCVMKCLLAPVWPCVVSPPQSYTIHLPKRRTAQHAIRSTRGLARSLSRSYKRPRSDMLIPHYGLYLWCLPRLCVGCSYSSTMYVGLLHTPPLLCTHHRSIEQRAHSTQFC